MISYVIVLDKVPTQHVNVLLKYSNTVSEYCINTYAYTISGTLALGLLLHIHVN